MQNHYQLAYKLLLTLWLGCTTGCTVYAPMQPTMPLVQAAGQTELGASLQPNGRLEATAAYSPAAHVLLTAGGTMCPKLGSNNFLVTRQYEAGAGGYLPLGSSWLLNGLGGFGQAVSNRGYQDLGSSYSEYNARYSKLFGQVGLANVQGYRSIGFTYRLTQVRFAALSDIRLGALPLSDMLRHEASFFHRETWGSNARWETQTLMGISVSGTPKLDANRGYPNYGKPEYQANRNLFPAFYASLGLCYRPDWNQR